MRPNPLQTVSDGVVNLARQRGFVLPREVREAAREAGLREGQWKDVLALARPSLRYRGGRYYYEAGVSDRVRRERDQQRAIQRAVRQMVREHRELARRDERRGESRVSFIQPVRVRAEDGREFSLLSRDISPTGIRLIGTQRLLGQKVRVDVPRPGSAEVAAPVEPGWSFRVRVLWTCVVGDGLFENGGAIIEVAGSEAP